MSEKLCNDLHCHIGDHHYHESSGIKFWSDRQEVDRLQVENNRLKEENERLSLTVSRSILDTVGFVDEVAKDHMKRQTVEIAAWKLKAEALWLAAKSVSGQLGIHPQEWHDEKNPEDSYNQRTPEMDQENSRVLRFLQVISAYEKGGV